MKENFESSTNNSSSPGCDAVRSSSSNSVGQWMDLPFAIEYLSNRAWHPGPIDQSYMSLEDYNKAEFEFYEAERSVVFKGVYVETDSCDCGDGYGCSHGSYPVGLKIEGYPDLYTEWDGDYIHVDNSGNCFSLRIAGLTMGRFYDALKLIEVDVVLHNEPNPEVSDATDDAQRTNSLTKKNKL